MWFPFVYMFVLLHAIKSNYNRIQILILCINSTMGAEILHDQVQQMIYGYYWICHPTGAGGVSMTRGYLLPCNIPGQYEPPIK